MSLPDKYLSHWLNQDLSKGAPGIPSMGLPLEGGTGNASFPGTEAEGSPEAAEVQALWRRFQLVQGLLGTLDSRVAPEELDRRVEAMLETKAAPAPSKSAAKGPNLEWDSLLEVLGSDAYSTTSDQVAGRDGKPKGLQESLHAPEFLDRIVEDRLLVIEEQLGEVRGRQRRMRWVRRSSLALSAALVLMLVPWGNLGAERPSAPLPLIQYSSLEGMRSAFPDQIRFVSQSGEFGAAPLSSTQVSSTEVGPTVELKGEEAPNGDSKAGQAR